MSAIVTPRGMKLLIAVVAINFVLTLWVLWNQQGIYVRHLYDAVFKHPAPVSAQDHQRGNKNSRIVVIEYGDFQCPYCRVLHKSLMDIQKTNDFLWVYRNYPLSYHDHAMVLAESAECAGQQGKFWEFGDSLYATPPQNPDPASLTALAGSLGMDQEKFRDCMNQTASKAHVTDQQKAGDALDIYGTPTFFINGVRFMGAVPPDKLAEAFKRLGG